MRTIETIKETINMLERELMKEAKTIRQYYIITRIKILEEKLKKLQNARS